MTQTELKSWVYDAETFRNFNCYTFYSPETKEVKVFTIAIALGYNDTEKLRQFLSGNLLLIGYNNLSYDLPMLAYANNYKNYNSPRFNTDLFNVSTKLVDNDNRNDNDTRKLRYAKLETCKQLDLMKLMAFDKLKVSLKQIAINLKWYKIQDLPLEYDHNVTKDEIELIWSYNLNDVMISNKLYESLQKEINLRIDLGKIYNIDFTNASDSKMANLILEKFYQEETGININDIKDLRTVHESIRLADCIVPGIEFKTNEMQAVYDDIASLVVTAKDGYKYSKKLSYGEKQRVEDLPIADYMKEWLLKPEITQIVSELNFNGTSYEVGIGGLHSVDAPGKFVANKNFIIRDADVASYYPNILINYNIVPAHLSSDFTNILRRITEERIAAKKSGDKTKANGLKITINSIFGKLGSETFWLQDNRAMLSVTVSGQLMLLMLIEALELVGIHTISANTDGIVCIIPKELEPVYNEVCTWWQQKTKFELEFTDYSLYVRSDVNNYITKKTNGETKVKGRYLTDIDLKKGYHHPIVARAMYEYFVNNKPVDETLHECTDILDFCLSQKMDKEFVLLYQTATETKELQKTNRFYVSNHGGSLVKVKKATGRRDGLVVGYLTQILNDYDSSLPVSAYDINYKWYQDQAYQYIKKIEKGKQHEQTNLFGNIQSADKPATVGKKATTKKKSVLQMKVDNYKDFLYPDVDKRYVFVTKVDKLVETYCLANGRLMPLKVTASNKRNIKEGMILYCEVFRKDGDNWWLDKFTVLTPKEKEEIFDNKSKAEQVTMF